MTTAAQKQREIAYATKAGELLHECWRVEASPDERNWPDLVVNAMSGIFGLEVREAYLDETAEGSTKKAAEAHNRKILRDLAKAYYRQSQVPIKVSLLGIGGDHAELLRLLAEEAQHLSVWEQRRLETSNDCVAYFTRLPEQLKDYSRWTFVSDHVGWVTTVDEEPLERIIALKAKKLQKYKKQIEDVRLLIVSDRIYNSGKAQITNQVQCKSYGFNAVYYLSYPEAAWTIVS